MSFNIHQLDRIDSCDEKADKALEKFQNEILEKFYRSLNEEAITDMDHEIGFWSAQLINYGFNYIGVTLPNMAVSDIEEIVTELFPKKITIDTPEEANITIPELKLFWQFLKREFNLKNSDLILKYLSDIEPNYNKIMNDPSRFGMAKSFVMSGKSAGFNMKNDSDFYKYALLHNANIAAQESETSSRNMKSIPAHNTKRNRSRKKKIRKIAKSSRKQNRKRK